MRSGWMRGSIFWVLLVWGRFRVSKTIIPEAQEHFLTPSAHRYIHLFGGLGLKTPRSGYSRASTTIESKEIETVLDIYCEFISAAQRKGIAATILVIAGTILGALVAWSTGNP